MDITNTLWNQIMDAFQAFIRMLPSIGFAIVLVIIFAMIAKWIRNKSIVMLGTRADDPLLLKFADNIFKIVNYVLAILLFLYVIGLSGIAASVLGAASISAVVLGFAFKDIGENFIAGIIMAFSRPFNKGDYIESKGEAGSVVAMTLRHTHIKTSDGKDVYIPNAQILKNPLSNMTIDGFVRKGFVIGVDYDSDIDKVREILLDNISSTPGVLTEDKGPRTLLKDLGSSTINIEVQYWLDTFDTNHSSVEVQTKAIQNSLAKLSEAGIGMPGDIVEVKNYNDKPMTYETRAAS